jgi:hypothetical protein
MARIPPADVTEARFIKSEAEVQFYENEVPAFVEQHLEQLYQSLFSTIARLEIYDSAKAASTYVARRNGAVVAVILFRRDRTRVTVYNEQLAFDGQELILFVKRLFARYKEVELVSFYAIRADIAKTPYPVQQEECLEDIVLALPPEQEAYLEMLGKNMRASIKRYQKKVMRDFPSFRVEFLTRETVNEQQIRKIVELSHARMTVKNQHCYHNELSTQRLIRLVRKYGVVLIATMDSQICAGVINHCVGQNYFLHVLAHDPRFDEYRLGKLCCYLSICHAIAQGAREYHFGWGRFDYKYKMGGENKALYRVDIYRSRLVLAANVRHACRVKAKAKVRQFKLWLERVDSGDARVSPGVVRALNVARKLNRTVRPRKG